MKIFGKEYSNLKNNAFVDLLFMLIGYDNLAEASLTFLLFNQSSLTTFLSNSFESFYSIIKY